MKWHLMPGQMPFFIRALRHDGPPSDLPERRPDILSAEHRLRDATPTLARAPRSSRV
jgi:outer membrane protein TolC